MMEGGVKAKVLIVDDDQDIVTMLQDRLDAGGYKTLTAGDGQRGLELIEQESPNLVLLDLYLPRLKGMDVLKRMAQNKQCEDIPVIVMTAAGTSPDAVEAMRHALYGELAGWSLGVVVVSTIVFYLIAAAGYDPQRGLVRHARGG